MKTARRSGNSSNRDIVAIMGLRTEPGWSGNFTREQARGAIPNGARIVKAWCEPGDPHRVGALGTVLGSFATPPEAVGVAALDGRPIRHFYFVAWDDTPRVAVGLIDLKIARADA